MLKNLQIQAPLECGKAEPVHMIAQKLRDSRQRHIFVLNKSRYPVGIISTTDINNKIVAEGLDPKKVKARDIMSSPIDVFDLNDRAVDVYKEMLAKKRMNTAVVEDKIFVGSVSINALFNYLTARNELKWD